MEWGMSDMLSTLEAELFVKKTVGELLFDGYEDQVMSLGSSFTDEDVPLDKFGWFYKVMIRKGWREERHCYCRGTVRPGQTETLR